MKWPWQSEKRSRIDSYTDAVVSAMLTRATGREAVPGALGAVEAATGFYSRSLASATVEPQNMLTAAVTPGFLAMVGRGLAERGNSLFFVEVQGGRLMLTSVSAWSMQGSPDPETHIYELTMAGPSETRTVRTPATSVLHFRINQESARPFHGRSPIQVASATGRLAAAVEKSLEREQSFLPGRVIYTERQGEAINDLLSDIARGGLVSEGSIDESTSRNATLAPHKIGPAPNETEADLRTDTGRSILAAFGLSPSLFESGSDGTSQRESFRRAFTTCLGPLALMCAEELTAKLETPVTLTLGEIRAADEQGRARGLASRAAAFRIFVTDGGMNTEQARELAGL